MSGLPTHTFSDIERNLVRGSIIARELLNVRQSITTARKDRDALLFADTPPTDDALKTAEMRRNASIARREFLRALDPSQVDVPVEKPISFKEGTGSGQAARSAEGPRRRLLHAPGLDLLVGGSIREVEGYLLVDIWAFDAIRGRVRLSPPARRLVGTRCTHGPPLRGKDLIGAILGRPWSLVAFDPDPPDSSLTSTGSSRHREHPRALSRSRSQGHQGHRSRVPLDRAPLTLGHRPGNAPSR